MPILTTINGIPLFSTVQEALTWARTNGLSGYHSHDYNGRTGYMGGSTHSTATGSTQNNNTPTTLGTPGISGGGY